MEELLFSNHLKLKNAKVSDPFWDEKIELVRKEVIPYQYKALHDNIDGAEKSYSIENFMKAGKIVNAIKCGKKVPIFPADKWHYDDNNAEADAFHGWVFQDSDVYKWIEAVGFSLTNHPDKDLEKKADEIIDIVCTAQLDNGYLDTLYVINNRDEIFTNLKDFHELYCFGHLLEGAISYYNATGKNKLLKAAIRFADLVCDTFGETKVKGYPGHEIAEMALVKLYELTNDKKYLETAKFFIDERGKKPYYYDIVLGRKTIEDKYHYNQAHKQPRFQSEAVGHAVRGVYLYSGMADIAKYFHDDELFSACENIFKNIENKKMYITGGIGSTVDGEAFSFNYDLPNDLAYSETCASIGLIFFARRMLEIQPDSRYGDVMERALYNSVLSGMSEDGKSFFYVNPLEVLPEASEKDSRKRHIKPVRQKWFDCACCPPNLARLISSLPEYCFGEKEDTIFIHQYLGGKFKFKNASIAVVSNYAENGNVEITADKPCTLAMRIPKWCSNYSISKKFELKQGYAYINVNENEKINVTFEVKPKIIKCSNRVRANIGKAAITKGPFVYCMEEADNGKDLQMLRLCADTAFNIEKDKIIAQGIREKADESLYSEYSESEYKHTKITFIPYYKWGNRGENEMNVYIRI